MPPRSRSRCRRARHGRVVTAACALAVLVALAAAPRSARASAQDIFGYGTRGPSMAGATVALARGFEAIYYNPAGLAATRGNYSIGVGYQLASYHLSIDSPSFANLDAAQRALVKGAADIDSVGGVTIGAALFIPLHGILKRRLALGFGFYIPNDVIIRAKLPRPYVPRFAVIDRANVVAIQLAGAVRIFDWLRVGGGVKALASLLGAIDVKPNAAGTLGSDVEDQLIVEYSEIFGVQATPFPWLRFGVTYRGEFVGRFKLPIDANLGPQFGALVGIPTLNVEGVAQYDPRQVRFAVAASPHRGLWVEMVVGWEQWSKFEQPLKAVVDCVPCDPSQPWCDLDNRTAHCLPPLPSPNFRDTVSLRIGAEWTFRISEAHHLSGVLRGGYQYQPSPVPPQRGLDNFLDSERHVFGLGLAARWELQRGMTLVVAAHVQLHAMIARSHYKTQWPPPGTSATDLDKIKLIAGDIDFRPYIRASGVLVAGGGAVSLEF